MTLEERKHALERAFNKGVPDNSPYVRRVFDMYRDEIAEIDFMDCSIEYGKQDQLLCVVLLFETKMLLSMNFDVETPNSEKIPFNVYSKRELLIADVMPLQMIVQYMANVSKRLGELKVKDQG